ncbi:MAG: nuclear transport factor 2 family protein [Pseudomonadota bacterium]
MVDESLRKQSQAVADKQAIHDVIMRFSRGLDRLDEALLKSCFHADSHDDHGHFKGSGHEFAAFIVKSLRDRTHHTTHAVANVLIELDDDNPDAARSEAYVIAYLRGTDDDGRETLSVFSGRYVDRFARRDGEWRIAKRVVVHDWSAATTLDANSFPIPSDMFTQGRRDTDDLVYET